MNAALIEGLTPQQQAEVQRFAKVYGVPVAKRYLQVLAGQKPEPAVGGEEPAQELVAEPKRIRPARPVPMLTARTQRDIFQDMTQERALATLRKVKPIEMVDVNGQLFLSSDQVALYYGCPLETVRSCLTRKRYLFVGEDGVERVTGKDLLPFKEKFFLNRHLSNFIAWTPRAVLRAGLMLRRSETAIKVQELLTPSTTRRRTPRYKTMSPRELQQIVIRYLGPDYYSLELMPVLREALVGIIADIDRIQGLENEQS